MHCLQITSVLIISCPALLLTAFAKGNRVDNKFRYFSHSPPHTPYKSNIYHILFAARELTFIAHAQARWQNYPKCKQT